MCTICIFFLISFLFSLLSLTLSTEVGRHYTGQLAFLKLFSRTKSNKGRNGKRNAGGLQLHRMCFSTQQNNYAHCAWLSHLILSEVSPSYRNSGALASSTVNQDNFSSTALMVSLKPPKLKSLLEINLQESILRKGNDPKHIKIYGQQDDWRIKE